MIAVISDFEIPNQVFIPSMYFEEDGNAPFCRASLSGLEEEVNVAFQELESYFRTEVLSKLQPLAHNLCQLKRKLE